MTIQNKPVIRIAPNNPVFDLPVIVGIEEGLFAQAGLDVASRPPTRTARRTAPTADHGAAQGAACSIAARPTATTCANGRASTGSSAARAAGNIAALRAAVAAQAILTFDEALQVPRDLADVPVVVQELTGSHYTTLQMLESAVGAEHVKIERGGLPQKRWAGLKDGHPPRGRGDGAVHQPRPQGGRAYRRGLRSIAAAR